MQQTKVYLLGASGHGKVILEILEANNVVINGIFDDNPALKQLLDYEVLGSFNPALVGEHDSLIISIGNNAIRKKKAEELKLHYVNAIHPSAAVSRRAKIGSGNVIMSGVSINSDCLIGNHAIINTNCSVDHDCVLEDYVHISPNAALAGNVRVGEGTHVGIGACVKQGINIGRWATIGAGAVIIKDVPDYAVVVGNPGKIIRYNNK